MKHRCVSRFRCGCGQWPFWLESERIGRFWTESVRIESKKKKKKEKKRGESLRRDESGAGAAALEPHPCFLDHNQVKVTQMNPNSCAKDLAERKIWCHHITLYQLSLQIGDKWTWTLNIDHMVNHCLSGPQLICNQFWSFSHIHSYIDIYIQWIFSQEARKRRPLD